MNARDRILAAAPACCRADHPLGPYMAYKVGGGAVANGKRMSVAVVQSKHLEERKVRGAARHTKQNTVI